MALVSKNIPNLINGVSQQPAALRLASQGETQENGFSDIVDGLKKRPPTEFKNVLRKGSPTGTALSSTELGRSHFHTYKRSDTEQFTVVYDPVDTKMRVYNIDGKLCYESGTASWDANGSQITSNSDSTAYLNGITEADITSTSVADYTFFVNKKKAVVRDETTPSNPRSFEGMFYFKQLNYDREVVCTVQNSAETAALFSGHIETADGDPLSEASTTSTGRAANHISGRNNHSGEYSNSSQMSFATGYVRGGANDTPFFTVSNATTDFSLKATDQDGGRSVFAHKDAIATFTSLPKYCVNGFTIQVNGDNQKKEDDFYVTYQGSQSSGTWKECPSPSRPSNPVYHNFNNTTMPHTLRQNADASFTFGAETWQDRKAGDDDTNPFPSFVGTTANPSYITDVFFHRNRLGFLSGENIIFSEASSYFNFFRTTVRSLLDSAPIDIAVSQNEVSNLEAATPTQDNLMLFSNLTQFSLSAAQLLTPAGVSIDQSTRYECDLTAKPVSVGTSIYFAHKDGNFSGLRELYTQGDSDTQDAPSITSHVPEYISGGVRQMIASSNEDMLVCLTDSNKKECFVYKWYDSDRERLQSSWSKWVFDQEVEHIAFNNTDVFFVFADGSFERMSLTNSGVNVLIDHRFKIESTGSLTDYPRATTGTTQYVTKEGGLLSASNVPTYLSTPGNYIYVGEPYTFKYQFSEQVFKPNDDPTRLARYQLRRISLNYNDTGSFDVTVQSTGRDPKVTAFTGRILSQANNILGSAPTVEDGTLTVGLQSQAKETDITIKNSSHLPSVFQNAEVEAYVNQRTRRI